MKNYGLEGGIFTRLNKPDFSLIHSSQFAARCKPARANLKTHTSSGPCTAARKSEGLALHLGGQFWWSCRADCHYDPRAGRGKALDFAVPLPTRPELLHSATRTRSPATGNLSGLAPQRFQRCISGGLALCATQLAQYFAVQLSLSGLRSNPGARGGICCGFWG